jgi:hypothetical protein
MERQGGGRLVPKLGTCVALAIVAAVTAATTASGADRSACWRAVLRDWSSGGIDQPHTVRCYRSALDNLPSDIRSYTTAEDDIRRALLGEIRSLRGEDGERSSSVRAAASSGKGTRTTKEAPTRSLQGRGDSSGAVASTTPAAATSPPLRALVAAGLALLLVLVAAIGKYHVRRRAPHAAP